MTEFQCKTKIYSGKGALAVLSSFKSKCVMIVTDSFFTESGKIEAVTKHLPGARIEIFDSVIPDPPAVLAAKGAALCNESCPELLIALGGGSVIDCAKGIRAACTHRLTFIAVPTTSGSGSEMTSFAILTHDGVKHPLVDPDLRPDVAILDSDLLTQLPKQLIADAGMDVLAHCLEAAVAMNRSGFTDALAACGAKIILSQLEKSYAGEISVRQTIHEAAAMAGIAFDAAGLGLCHAAAHALGGAFHLPHGRLCAMLLPVVIGINAQASADQYAWLARICGLSGQTDRIAVRNLQQSIVRLRRSLSLPNTLSEAKISREQWLQDKPALIAAVLEDPCCETNPIPVTETCVRQLLEAVYA